MKVRTEVVRTLQLGSNFAAEFKTFKLAITNRRLKVGDSQDLHEPVFKAQLWKVKGDGDRKNDGHWFKRDMWLSKNGSLVYFSKKDERELVYYTHSDVAKAKVTKIPNEESGRPWSFQVCLPGHDGVEFSPGEFAAESEEMREQWLRELARVS